MWGSNPAPDADLPPETPSSQLEQELCLYTSCQSHGGFCAIEVKRCAVYIIPSSAMACICGAWRTESWLLRESTQTLTSSSLGVKGALVS